MARLRVAAREANAGLMPTTAARLLVDCLVEQVLLSAVMCLVSAWLAVRLYKAEKLALAAA